MPLKDEVLWGLSDTHNVAQFASFAADEPALRFSRLRNGLLAPGTDLTSAVRALLEASGSASVNVRSFRADRASGNPFHYGITDEREAIGLVRQLSGEGFHTIVNETIDVHDGGVSGVIDGGIVEFAPGNTPRAVESDEHATLSLPAARIVLSAVYGFDLNLGGAHDTRLEFSVHPMRVGARNEHSVVWEASASTSSTLQAAATWPNPFSKFIGDKAYGLLVAHAMGFSVPRTTVFSRRIAPFSFGDTTGTAETWLRTAPAVRTPGRFTTTRGWRDPFAVLANEDPEGTLIASVLAQEGVDALFSGAAAATGDGGPVTVEGVHGFGDQFMLGTRLPSALPCAVQDAVTHELRNLEKAVGATSIEWAYDGRQVWVLQLHQAGAVTEDGVLVPGEPSAGWLVFKSGHELEELRDLVDRARVERKGVLVEGRVGLTSHIGDLLRLAEVPARLADRSKAS